MDILITISVLLLVFAFHQYFLSTAIFILRKSKSSQLEELTRKTPVNEFWPARAKQELPNHWVTSKRFKRFVSLPWFLYAPPFLLFVLAIFIVATGAVVGTGPWWFGIYHLILAVDIVWLLKMKREIIEQTVIERFWLIFPTIRYPKKILNVIFQPCWAVVPFIIMIIVVTMIRK